MLYEAFSVSRPIICQNIILLLLLLVLLLD